MDVTLYADVRPEMLHQDCCIVAMSRQQILMAFNGMWPSVEPGRVRIAIPVKIPADAIRGASFQAQTGAVTIEPATNP